MAGRKGEKIWADAVRRAVMRRMEDEEGKPKKLERLADRLVEAALDGDIPALKEIGDRLDGKPAQAITGPGPEGEHLHRVASDEAFTRLAGRLGGAAPGTASGDTEAE